MDETHAEAEAIVIATVVAEVVAAAVQEAAVAMVVEAVIPEAVAVVVDASGGRLVVSPNITTVEAGATRLMAPPMH